MFQISRSSIFNQDNIEVANSPNNESQVRTLKEDLARLKTGEKEAGEANESLPQTFSPPPPPSPKPILPEKKTESLNISAPKTFPPASSNPSFPGYPPPGENKQDIQKNELPNPFGSDSFFKNRLPFDEKAGNPQQKFDDNLPKAQSSGKLVAVISFLLIISIFGGGAYYWWFFMRTTDKSAPTIEKGGSQILSEPEESPNLKKWILDPEAAKPAAKTAIESNLSSLSDSEGKTIEIKIISKNNQPIAPKKFEEIFDFQLPVSVSGKLTDDYSLFFTKEGGKPRLGAAFKLSQSENLAESLRSEEGSFFSNLKSFYLDSVPNSSQVSFSPGKYKNADIRYFNFPGNPDISLDYSVISSKQNAYFVFSTSKNSFRAILDYMSEK